MKLLRSMYQTRQNFSTLTAITREIIILYQFESEPVVRAAKPNVPLFYIT